VQIDYLIIGQGLAGSLLAWELIQRKRRVVVLDPNQENASQVAAGLINPVTGKRLVKTDTVDTLLPVAHQLYRELSRFFKQDFLIEKPMLRLLRTPDEVNSSRARLQDSSYQAYLGTIIPADRIDYPLNNLIAALIQKQTAYLLTRPLLASLKAYFIGLDSYRQATVDYPEIKIRPVLQWQDLQPERIIFCEGFKALHNPWFGKLPFQPAKGQILTLRTEQPVPDYILNYGNWLTPIDSRHFRIGATFERDTLDLSPTEIGKHQLLQALRPISAKLAAAAVIDQQANIRPCTQDRQPFIGSHPEYPEFWLFNGFGAKGSLQIPWYSRHLADVLLTGQTLESTCNIKRL